jgi:hypothetical protein
VGGIAEGSSVSNFNLYSQGLGALGQRSGRAGGALSSNMQRNFSMGRSMTFAQPDMGVHRRSAAGMGISRPSGSGGMEGHYFRRVGPGTASSIAPPPMPESIFPAIPEGLDALTALAGTVDTLNDLGGAGAVKVLLDQEETAMGAARAYLRALEQSTASRLRDRTKPITTLVPGPASQYRDYMARGDRAFRANNFLSAYTDFQIANDMGSRDPESMICLAHTQFALSRCSYVKASYYLQEALKAMPELPLANLRPRGFYGSAATYAEHLVSLQEYIERNGTDGEALLLLAYFRWYGQARDVAAAQNALSRSLRGALAANNTHLVEAVETFWDGMVAAGAVEGKLKPYSANSAAVGTARGDEPVSAGSAATEDAKQSS